MVHNAGGRQSYGAPGIMLVLSQRMTLVSRDGIKALSDTFLPGLAPPQSTLAPVPIHTFFGPKAMAQG